MERFTEIGPACYCGAGDFSEIEIKEQMLGFCEPFIYAVCRHCGHAYLRTPPNDLAKYYPPATYYSFNAKKKKGLPGFFSSAAMKAFSHLSLDKRTYILDYGCGNGQFVVELRNRGYTGATGYDPFLLTDQYENGAPVLRRHLHDNAYYQYYDAITMNHVLEHLPSPLSSLRTVVDMLKQGGFLIIRIPVKDSYAQDRYGSNWAQWDAPRHFHLFTRKSLRNIVSNLNVDEIVMYDDSNHFQFTASEIYVKGGSLKEDNRFLKRVLSIKAYKYALQARQLNKRNRGDQVTLILKKNDNQSQ